MTTDFRFIPCHEVHPFAKKIGDFMLGKANDAGGVTDERFAGVITLAAQVLAYLMIKMLHRTNNYFETDAALRGLFDMVQNMMANELHNETKSTGKWRNLRTR